MLVGPHPADEYSLVPRSDLTPTVQHREIEIVNLQQLMPPHIRTFVYIKGLCSASRPGSKSRASPHTYADHGAEMYAQLRHRPCCARGVGSRGRRPTCAACALASRRSPCAVRRWARRARAAAPGAGHPRPPADPEVHLLTRRNPSSAAVLSELTRKHGINRATYFNWRAKYGGVSVSERSCLIMLRRANCSGRALASC